MKSKEIKNLTDKIRNVLLKQHTFHLRDNDMALARHIWNKQAERIYGTSLSEMTIDSFLQNIESGNFINYDTITRARRKCNETYPETRGESYKRRKDDEDEIRKNINS